MTTTITIDAKKYFLHRRDYQPADNPIRRVDVGLTGKHLVQDFGVTVETLDVTILVYVTPPRPDFGSEDDLRIAFGKMPVDVVDIDGQARQMVWQGQLNLPRDFSLIDSTVPFKVQVNLEKYRV